MTVVMGRAEKGARGARRTTPEREPAAGNPLIEPRADLEPVVAVMLVVRDQRGDLVPHGTPERLAGKPQTGRETSRITERKIEPGQHAVAALHGVGEHLAEHRLCGVPGGRVFQQ